MALSPNDDVRNVDPLILPIAEVVRYAQAAGFVGDSLVTIVAIAGAETGGTWNAHAVGDRDLTQPGEMSVGLWQVNYRPTRDKTEAIRDPNYNLDPANNAAAAYAISNGGRNFKPWSTFGSGAYRAFLQKAKDAISGFPEPGFTAPADSGVPVDPSTPILTGFTNPLGDVLPIRIGGTLPWGELGAAVVGGQIDLTTDQVSEMSVELEDPGLQLVDRYRLNINSPVDNYGIHWQVVELRINQGPANPHVTLLCHPTGAVKLRTGTGSSARKISPSNYMSSLAKAAGLRFVGEPSAVRDTIAPSAKQDVVGGMTVSRPETGWEVGQRLAAELGFLAFEAAGTYYFGSPKFLIGQGRRVQFAYRGFTYGTSAGPVIDVLSTPDCTAATRRYIKAGTVLPGTVAGTTTTYLGTMDVLDDITVSVEVERPLGEGLRPAMCAAIAGVGPFNQLGLMVTRVSWTFDSLTSPVRITTGTVADVVASDRTAEDDTAAAGVTAGKTKSNLDFVTAALRQVGDAYVYGAEVSLTDPDPDAFDCSELVQWAAAQVGVKIADGSGAQKAACKPITIATAAKTRGALLFRPGHVAISLGDGKNTVEAKGRKYGVVSGGKDGVIGNRFTSAGLIPGMAYS